MTTRAPGHVAVNLEGGTSPLTFFEPPAPPPSFVRTVRGRVLDDSGRPVANAAVVIGAEIDAFLGSVPGESGGVTDDGGSFAIAVHGEAPAVAVALHPQAGWSKRMPVSGGKADVELTLRIPTPGSLGVTVRRGGEPTEAEIQVTPLDEVAFRIAPRTDRNGTLTLPLLPPGRYRVKVFATQLFLGPSSPPIEREVQIQSGKTTNLAIDLPTGALVVASMRPPPNVEVMIVEYFLIPGSGTFTRELLKQKGIRGYLFGGEDVNAEAQFGDREPGAYTVCLDAHLKDGSRLPLACEALDVSLTKPVNSIEIELRR